MKISVVSGGFDPIHSGHIDYLNSAKKIGDYLVVALNSDEWLIKKKKKVFMSLQERKSILMNIECVDEVIVFEDDDQGSCINALEQIKLKFPNDRIIFWRNSPFHEISITVIIFTNFFCKNITIYFKKPRII